MTPWKLIISGTRATAKNALPIAQALNSVRPVQPMKGTQNPPHLQQNLPASIIKKIKEERPK